MSLLRRYININIPTKFMSYFLSVIYLADFTLSAVEASRSGAGILTNLRTMGRNCCQTRIVLTLTAFKRTEYVLNGTQQATFHSETHDIECIF